ncbi:MAG: polysaccharide deacetylase family protein [bacterium]
MSSFFYIFLCSYALGLVGHDFIEKREHHPVWDFLKGIAALTITRIYLNTGLALLVATVGVTLGHTWPVTERPKERDAKMVLLGALTLFSPLFALVVFAAMLMSKRLAFNPDHAILLLSIIWPFILLLFDKPDAWILAGLFMLLINLLQVLPRLHLYSTGSTGAWPVKRVFVLRTLTTLLVITVVVLFFFNRYVYKGYGMQIDVIRSGPPDLAFVALTFDDGPDPVYTPQILDILRDKGVPATFFLVGKNALKYPETVLRTMEEGHSIGNHTYSHRSLIPLSNTGVYNEIMQAEEAITQITGQKPTLFRPPRGVCTEYTRSLLREQRYTLVLWDVSSHDWEEIRYTDIVNNVMRNVRRGSIILFHDSGDLVKAYGGNRNNTVRALPIIIDRLRDQGYEFLTIDEMLVLSGLSETEDGGYYEDY